MYNDRYAPARPLNTARPVPSGAYNNYAGGYATRRDRFDMRVQRRYGDWSVLAFPPEVLWFDPFYAPVYEPAITFGLEPVAPIVIDIWG